MDPATRQAGWPWPLHKLQANLAAQEARAQPHAPLPVPVVLLMTGGLCPVHKCHVAMMEQAKDCVEANGMRVVAGFMSPTHASYTSMKMSAADYIDTKTRQQAVALATADSTWLDVGRWEGNLGSFTDFPNVCRYLQKHLDQQASQGTLPVAGVGDDGLRVVYVAGGDNISFQRAVHHMVCVPRAGTGAVKAGAGAQGPIPQRRRLGQLWATDDRLWVADAALEEMSSTEVRANLQDAVTNKARLLQLLHPAVYNLLVHPQTDGLQGAGAGAPRHVYVSASALARRWASKPKAELEAALFFFGSKRSWIYPANDAEAEDSRRQPTNYSAFDPAFKDLILAKEQRGEVFFLKPEDLDYKGYGTQGAGDPQSYVRASEWLVKLTDPTTGQHYKPLILDPGWWLSRPSSPSSSSPASSASGVELPFKFEANAGLVVHNFETGEHEYGATMELVYQSNPTLIPKSW